MMHFKNHKFGFTIIETVLAMAIAGLVIPPVFILHGSLLQRVNRSSRLFNALLLGKHFLYEARQKQAPEVQEFTDKKNEYGVTVQYALHKEMDKKSTLHACVGLHKELVTIGWNESGQQRKETLITFVYKQPEQKK